MKFYKWRTTLDEAAKYEPATRRLPFYVRFRAFADLLAREHTRSSYRELTKLTQECLWERDGKPYYNINPLAVPHLCRARLNDTPASLLEIPAGFHAINIRLAKEHPDLSIEPGKLFVRTMFLAWGMRTFMAGETFPDALAAKKPQGVPHDRQLALHIDTGELGQSDGVATAKHWVLHMSTDNESTLEAGFQDSIQLMKTHDFERACPGTRLHDVLLNCLRLVATVFLTDCNDEKFFEYDVIAKHRTKFRKADDATKAKLIDKARRRGKVGWNFGTNEMFAGSFSASTSPGPKGKYELQSAHIRAGHLHAVRYGPGKKYVKIQWFRPTVVRPDLGFSED
ncbi:MAG: hypothetical protein HQ567_11035 [Candidatus Nealsonbacteria bacterium]|nr:hypothetical protein [Candidatus Nealsonbacteria bacterium]